jgi:predicted secreted Zn-dependent protease
MEQKSQKNNRVMIVVLIMFVFLMAFLSGCGLASIPAPAILTPEAAATATLASPTLEPAAVGLVHIPNALIVYYDISGSNESELRAQLDSLGPVGFDGYKGDATTNWDIRWNWPGYGSGSCDLSAATVSYEIEVVIPRWMPPENTPPELVAKWTNYIRVLAEHEKGHVDFIVANHQSVTDAIKEATCDTAEAAGQAVLTFIRQHDIDYDAATDHGATQGARFP